MQGWVNAHHGVRNEHEAVASARPPIGTHLARVDAVLEHVVRAGQGLVHHRLAPSLDSHHALQHPHEHAACSIPQHDALGGEAPNELAIGCRSTPGSL